MAAGLETSVGKVEKKWGKFEQAARIICGLGFNPYIETNRPLRGLFLTSINS
jgi:hypothetical protein